MAIDSLTVTQALDSLTVSANDGANSLLTGGTISGNFQIDGTLTTGADDTGYDVKFFGDTASKFMHWDASEDELKLPDSTKLTFGTGGDLELYHDGTDSRITDVGTGDLIIQGSNDIWIMHGSDTAINTNDNGSVDLYYNNSKKFETTNTGATITGKLICTGDLDVSGTTTTFNSTTVLVEDPILTLGGTDPAGSDDNKDRGIEFHYHDGSSARVGFFGYDDSASAFTFLTAATNSSEVFSGTVGNLNVGNVLFGDGSAGTPSISFSSDTNTGLYRISADKVGISTGGTLRADIDQWGLTLVGQLLSKDGSASSPSVSFGSSTDTGFYHYGADTIGISTGGNYRAKFGSDGLFETWAGIQLKGGVIRTTDGNASAPSYSFESDTDTGFYYSSNTIYASFAGSAAWLFKGDYIGSSASFAAMVTKAAGSAAAPSYSFMSDTDTGIFRVAADQLGISTGGSERVHIYNDGFDLNNLSLVFKDSGGTGRATVSIPSQHFAINVYGTSGWINNVLNIDNDTGHIGIGTASPAASLQIDTPAANNAGQGIRINRPSAGTNYHSVEFSTDGTVDWSVGQNSNDAFEIYEDGASATTRFTIKEGGNVGIGTTAPVGKLTVVDTTSSATAQKFHVGRATNAGLYITDTDDSSYIKAIQDEDEAGYGNLILAADSAGSKDGFISFESEGEKMRITADGKVGIGTTAPASKLHVTGTVQVGVDDTGHDVKFFGATSGRYMLWDESENALILPDHVQFRVGSGYDLRMYHTGDSYLRNYTGSLNIENEATDQDIIFRASDGSSTELLRLDGSASSVNVPDNVVLKIGASGQSLRHNGSEAYINNTTGNWKFTQGASDKDFIWYTTPSSTGTATELMRLDGSTSRIGIGTTTPQHKLDVDGIIRSSHNIVSNSSYTAFTIGSDRTNDDYGGVNKDYWKVDLRTAGSSTTGESSAHAYGDLVWSGVDGVDTTFHERMVLRANGNVGLGVSVPASPLHIEGPFTISRTDVTAAHSTIDMDGNFRFAAYTGYNITFHSDENNIGGSEIVRFGSNGKVGIGVSSPAQKLSVQFADTDTSFSGGTGGAWGSEGLLIENTSSTANTMAMIQLRTGDADLHIAGIRQGTNDSDLGFFFEGSEKMRMTSTGMGIGTSSIDYPLVVSGASTTSGGSRFLQKVVDTTSMASGVGGGLVFSGQTGSTTGERFLSSIHGAKTNGTDNDYGGDLVFNTRANGGGLAEVARFTSDGNLLLINGVTISKGITTSITTVNNTDYTLATTDHIIIFTNLSTGRTLTLPTAQAVAGRMVIVKEKDGYASSNNITIATEGSETIDGSSTATLSTNKGTIRLTSDGTNWLII